MRTPPPVVDHASLWREIAHLAERQWGHVARGQVLGLGATPAAIANWVRRGRLVPVHAGVYAVGYQRVEPVARAMAAVLAGGDRAVLSHDSALALWGLDRRWPQHPELIVPGRVRRPGIVAHRSTTLTRADTTVQLGVPVTRAARALADVRPRLGPTRFIRLVNDARLRRLVSADEAHVLLGHRRNPTRSGGEDRLAGWLTHHGFAGWETNADVNGHEVDVVFAAEKVVLQLDHLATHSDPLTFASDRAHDRADADLGYLTIRLTVEDLRDEEADRLRRILAGRRRPGPPAC